MAEYPVETGKLALIWAAIHQDDTRYLRARIYRPDDTLFSTQDLSDEGNGYHESRNLTFNGDDFWRVEIDVYLDAGRTQRDPDYPTLVDYLWKKDGVGGSGGTVSVGGVIELEIDTIGEVQLEAENTLDVNLETEDQNKFELLAADQGEISLEIEEKPVIELELECQE